MESVTQDSDVLILPSVLSLNEPQEFSYNELRLLKHRLELKHLDFVRYFLKKREGSKFILNAHHKVLAKTLDRVFSGEIKRLIINVPPGYTKTEMINIGFVARGFAMNPASRFVQVSYSDDLVMLNATLIRDIIRSEEYQQLWPIQLKQDTQSKKQWNTESGGCLRSAPSGGQVTGFRAGRMVEEFSGALIVDDPLKPEDAYSTPKRVEVNRKFTSTLRSRLAHEGVPIVVIGQRIHSEDLCGFLLRGGSGEKWHHLNMPIEIKKNEKYPEAYTHGIEIPHGLEAGPLWQYKHTAKDIAALRDSDPYTFAAQYAQAPDTLDGGVFKRDWFKFYDAPPSHFRQIVVYSDTALKTGEHNDYSVFALFGVVADGANKKLYVLDVVRGKFEAPDLLDQAKNFWERHKHKGVKCQGASAFRIEDKASGIGLIQQLSREIGREISGIPRNTDKLSRAMSAVSAFARGQVFLPSGPTRFTTADWTRDYIEEFLAFSKVLTHKNDDQVDVTLDAVEEMLQGSGMLAYENL
jgi:predicted phage terminase large subunit-like protein